MDRPLLMIPGPIEMDERVLQAAATIGTSHVDPGFIKAFGRTLHKLKDVFLADDGQPFVVSGSGSLGWDMLSANVLEEGDEALVISQGYFGDAWAEWMTNQGIRVTKIKAEPGTFPAFSEIEKLDLKRFKVATVTHVDTSTAVRAPVKEVAELLRKGNSEIIIGVDSVAALGGETLKMKEWDIDFVMTGSQKALSVPSGLSVTMARPRALQAAEKRSSPVKFTYVSWKKWQPIMQNYMSEKGSYFATPAVSLVFALDVALDLYLANGGTQARFREHAQVASAFRSAAAAMGLKPLCVNPEYTANTLTALYYPKGVDGGKLLTDAKANNGCIFAGGLPPIGNQYFRVGHMGHSVAGGRRDHVAHALSCIEKALNAQGQNIPEGTAIKAFDSALNSKL